MDLLASHLLNCIGQYNKFKLLCESVYDMNLDIIAYSRPREVEWSRCEPSRYHHDFKMELVSNGKSTVETVRKRLNSGAVLTYCELLEVPVNIVAVRR